MPRTNYSERIKNINDHIKVINDEMGGVQKELSGIKSDIAVIKTNFNWMRYIIVLNVTLWVAVFGKLVVGI